MNLKEIGLFLVLSITVISTAVAEPVNQECYGKLEDQLIIDNIPLQIVDKPFPVRAHLSSSAIQLLHKEGHKVTVAIQLSVDPEEFFVYEPTKTMQEISKDNGVWEWKVRPKKAGEHNILSFHVSIQNGSPITDCIIEKEIIIKNLPKNERVGNWLASNMVNIIGWLIAIFLGCLNSWQINKKK